MSPEDALLAVERHASSKIASAADLDAILTLGFRGEALPSIGAVSRLEIVTREPDALAGTRLVVRGGRLEACEQAGCPAGTRVTVTELFFNTPARRKHLKSAAFELDRCLRVVTALALARPGVAFRVRHQGRTLLATPGTGSLAEAVAAAFGRELAALLVPVAAGEGDLRLSGYVGLPAAARSTRSYQFFSVNGRPAGGYPLREALEEAFAGLLMSHRHPVAFLSLEVDPRAVDVNVHPAKLRVRFRDEAAVARLVREAVQGALARSDLSAPALRRGADGWRVAEAPLRYGEEAAAGAQPQVLPLDPPAERSRARWPTLRVVGQVDSTYVLAEGEDGLYIIDQHAAHERLNYERYLRLRAAGARAGQPLAAPLPVRVGPGLVGVWEAERARVEALGFLAEPFGPDTLLLREVPAFLAGQEGERAFRDLLDRLAAEPAGEWREEEALAWLAGRACRASVRARDPLSRAEMEHLVAELGGADNPFTCPHGRPTVVRLTRRDLERLFGRA